MNTKAPQFWQIAFRGPGWAQGSPAHSKVQVISGYGEKFKSKGPNHLLQGRPPVQQPLAPPTSPPMTATDHHYQHNNYNYSSEKREKATITKETQTITKTTATATATTTIWRNLQRNKTTIHTEQRTRGTNTSRRSASTTSLWWHATKSTMTTAWKCCPIQQTGHETFKLQNAANTREAFLVQILCQWSIQTPNIFKYFANESRMQALCKREIQSPQLCQCRATKSF